MNDYEWYKLVDPDTEVTQGDIIDNCPVLNWDLSASGDLLERAKKERVNCVVMSQACDLEQAQVEQVILCPNYPLDEYEDYWSQSEKERGQNPTPKSWDKFLKNVSDGKIWNLAMLNKYNGMLSSNIRIVDFHEIFSVPRDFLEAWLVEQSAHRLTLLPPYREHLSQAFARYFMRVGLPIEIDLPS